MKKLVRTKVVPLLQCTDTEVLTGEKCGKIAKEEILFVGNTRSVFRDVIQNIIPTKHKLAVYGKGCNQFIDAEYIIFIYNVGKIMHMERKRMTENKNKYLRRLENRLYEQQAEIIEANKKIKSLNEELKKYKHKYHDINNSNIW